MRGCIGGSRGTRTHYGRLKRPLPIRFSLQPGTLKLVLMGGFEPPVAHCPKWTGTPRLQVDYRCINNLAGPDGQAALPLHHLRHQTQCFFTPQPHKLVDAHGNLTRPAYSTHLVPNNERLTSIISVPTILLSFCAALCGAVGLTVPYTSVEYLLSVSTTPRYGL